MKDKKDYINEIYRKALGAGLCKSQREFASILQVNEKGLSAAMNGNEKNLTDNLVLKVRFFAVENGLEGEGKPTQEEQQQDGVFIPKETMDMYTSMAKALENLSEIVRTSGGFLPSYLNEKNFKIDKR